jgi:malate dehydrogenase (oxaloacetate-decarboxylating)
MQDLDKAAIKLHRDNSGKIRIESTVPVKNKKDLSLAYTPGIAAVSRAVAKDPTLSYDLTWRGHTVAVISDGSAVLGLGNIGPEAALPVMEGKALLLKEFGTVDAVPIVINTQESSEIISFIKNIAPSFAGINLEDISAPRCFQIEDELQDIGIPVFHDDQHGTAIVVSAALKNAAKVVGKSYENLHVTIVGAGAAGLAIARMLLGLKCTSNTCERIKGAHSVADVVIVDTYGAFYAGRENQNVYKQALAGISNTQRKQGPLSTVIKDSDVVIGVSGPNTITEEMIKSMNKKAIVFALANPTPEIMPDVAKKAGAAIVATGRSDFENQINNVLAFPGIFRAVVEGHLKKITHEMKQTAADALAELVKNPSENNIIPDPFYPNLSKHISDAILHLQASEVK